MRKTIHLTAAFFLLLTLGTCLACSAVAEEAEKEFDAAQNKIQEIEQERAKAIKEIETEEENIEKVEKEVIAHHLEAKTKRFFNEFFQCQSCGKVYWKGSHYENMKEVIESVQKGNDSIENPLSYLSDIKAKRKKPK